MSGSTLADAVLVVHALFIAFALGGGVLVAFWPRLAWLHVPAVAWAVWVTAMGWVCPLTHLENHLRLRDGGAAYDGGFIAHYVGALVYPAALTRPLQVALGLALLALNLVAYARLLRMRRTGMRPPDVLARRVPGGGRWVRRGLSSLRRAPQRRADKGRSCLSEASSADPARREEQQRSPKDRRLQPPAHPPPTARARPQPLFPLRRHPGK